MKHSLFIKSYPQEGDFQHTYSPLRNLMMNDGSIGSFRVKNFGIDLGHPINIECQPSYDGTVNLIINDDKNPPRIINSRFSKIEDNRFRIINRNQKEQTNLYKEDKWDVQTRLFRTSVTIPVFHFLGINYYGQLKGGNYTFYAKFADDDYNQTDVLCESGQIPIFKGSLDKIASISGTLADELTDKSIRLKISNIDTSFSKVYLYYTREYSDLNGFRQMEVKSIVNPYEITGTTEEIIINGYESIEEIDISELNIKYNYTNSVKTQAQVQNMLFFGNIESSQIHIAELRNLSYFFTVHLLQKDESIGYVNPETYNGSDTEYYSPHNVYYNLGYWPGEIYRLGVVYIMNDDSLSPVFNLRGCYFENVGDHNFNSDIVPTQYWKEDGSIESIEVNKILTNKNLINSYGVFRNAYETTGTSIIQKDSVKPWYYKISLENQQHPINENYTLYDEFKRLGVKGYFFVRQKRIPITLCQGLSVGVDTSAHIPTPKYGGNFIAEGFLYKGTNKEGKSAPVLSDKVSLLEIKDDKVTHSCLLSVDAMLNPSLQSTLDGSKFSLQRTKNGVFGIKDKRRFYFTYDTTKTYDETAVKQCVYVNEDVPYKYIDGYEFSTRVGNAESVKQFSYFGKSKYDIQKLETTGDFGKNEIDIVRGIYCPIIGVCGNLKENSIYNIRIPNYSNMYTKEYFSIRANDNSEYYAISDRFPIENIPSWIHDVYRGDCFTNTVTVRLNRNFTDPDTPINDSIVDPNTWNKNYKGKDYMVEQDIDSEELENNEGNWTRINRADVNAVQLGLWVTYKCLSNNNLGLRSLDRSYPNEQALMGSERTFFPMSDLNTKSSGRISESKILNNGYSATVGRKMNILAPDIPYVKDMFDSRIMFSNVNVEGDFKNGYRVFQGLSYKDIDRQYGAIVKLLDWGTNLLCVFEHGLAIIPINEKALIQTTTEQPIHMYGAGVLQNQVSLISPDFGSIWPESIVRTPIGVYGVDTYAKKIWRYTTERGLETISDMKIQRFLNDNILLNESDKYPIVALKNVKTHYNNYKGDVMFTFYNFNENSEWNICYNERMDKWITRYSWTPLYSENINNIFYTLDKKRSEILSHIYYNKYCTRGIRSTNNLWSSVKTAEGGYRPVDGFETKLSVTGINNKLMDICSMEIKSIETSYIDNSGTEVKYEFPESTFKGEFALFHFTQREDKVTYDLSWSYNDMKREFRDKVGFEDPGIPLYYKIKVQAIPKFLSGMEEIPYSDTLEDVIGVVIGSECCSAETYDNLMINGFYVHGRAGIFDEIDYTDDDPDNQIKPTHWYGKQEPFEFEFVVNEDTGLHKIFENLVIISNRVKPTELEFEITGDVYDIFKNRGEYNKEEKRNALSKFDLTKQKITLKKDSVSNQYSIVIPQTLRDLEHYGRRGGNIHYKEDSWYITVDPLRLSRAINGRSSTRIRDKYLKVRVRYSGEDLVIITAIKNLYNITYS